MATIQDLNIIKVIHEVEHEAKEKRLNVVAELSGGEEGFRKALSSIKSAGVVTFVALIIGFAVTAATNIAVCGNGPDNACSYAATGILGILALIIVPIILSFKIQTLTATPTFTLVSLILMLLANLLLSVGIIPLVALVFTVIALVRWSTYRNWFYSIDVDYYNKKNMGRKK